ncbi:MAG TPA: hypothetical protein VFS25_16425 [Chitinophaga sp.]|uniref:hypothetical protein n=1 Tax=Chitinophaga sp. TaxID=1869181 RepID=UPI002DB7AE92|nr:hypothetical protein [Chitinophaga sp.]HEU4554434.1 hypothetical protein [Chitinophaga sp.]
MNNNDENYGSIVFTARGENVSCTDEKNEAVFEYQPQSEKYNLLTIQGSNDDEPVHHENSIVLSLLTNGDLKTGTYPIIDDEDLLSCRSGTKTDGCVNVASGVVSSNDEVSTAAWGTKDVRSTGAGNLTIEKIDLGAYHAGESADEAGYTEGRISGTFKYSGVNWDKTSTGTAAGKFENIPLKIYDK